MSIFRFEVSGLPIGKGAARHTRRGFTYTDTKTRNYMDKIKECALKAGAEPVDKPCMITIQALFPVPESHSNKLKQLIREGKFLYTKKPDTDNLSKIKDALNGVAFKDDCLVFNESVKKYYSDNPRLIIEIRYMDYIPTGLGYMQ